MTYKGQPAKTLGFFKIFLSFDKTTPKIQAGGLGLVSRMAILLLASAFVLVGLRVAEDHCSGDHRAAHAPSTDHDHDDQPSQSYQCAHMMVFDLSKNQAMEAPESPNEETVHYVIPERSRVLIPTRYTRYHSRVPHLEVSFNSQLAKLNSIRLLI